MSPDDEMCHPYCDDALIKSVRHPAPRKPHVDSEWLFTSTCRDYVCDQFWLSHGCDLPRGHPGDHLCLTPEDEAANDWAQHGRIGIVSVCSSAAAA